MIKKLFKLGLAVAILLNYSCEKDNDLTEKENSQNFTNEMVKREFSGDSIVLQNPYSLSNMRKSLSIIKEKNPNSTFTELQDYKIEASHLYIKFKPRNEEDEYLLKADTTMFLFDYRLDCEYKDDYLDNRIPKNDSIPDYYTSVSINKQLPNVPFEVIDELYIPEQDIYFNDTNENEKYLITYQINNKTDLFNHLIFDAFINTGNEEEVLEEGSTQSQRWFFGKRWRPKGTIRIFDNVNGQKANGSFVRTGELVPLEGAQILMRQLFTIDNGITNANGYFSTGLVRGHARYIIQWERHNYSIRSGWFGQAELRGPKWKKRDWNLDIQGGKQEYYGTIHRGAHHYYYRNIGTLRRPPEKSFWRKQIKIAAYLTNNGTSYNAHYTQIIPGQPWPTITLKRYEDDTDAIIGTTIHELAHSTHARHAGMNHFIGSEGRMKETYAQTIEWQLTGNFYRERFPSYVFENNYQFRTPLNDPKYTSLMVDLIDNFNQRVVYNNSIYPVDRVNSYTIKQVEDKVMDTKTFYSFKNALFNGYSNPTENNLDELFNNW